MGNSVHNSVGDALHACGAVDVIGFDTSARMVINMHEIEPWPARALVKGNLQRQAALAKRTPLRSVPVQYGMEYFRDKVGGWFAHMTRDKFVRASLDLLNQCRVSYNMEDQNALYAIFDSMDFDGNGELSVGEWAGGLTVFFKGNMSDCIHAVFDTLDTNGDRSLDKGEMAEYLKPFVKAMTPLQAAPLRPLLLKKATDVIFYDMDYNHDERITSEEMYQWSARGNNMIDIIAKIIEKEVYDIWIQKKNEDQRLAYSRGQYGPGYGPNSRERGYSPNSRDGYGYQDDMRGYPQGRGGGWDNPGRDRGGYGPGGGWDRSGDYGRRDSYGPPPRDGFGSPDYGPSRRDSYGPQWGGRSPGGPGSFSNHRDSVFGQGWY